MKFNAATAISALGALYLGQQQGRQMARDRQMQEQDDYLRLLPQLARMEEDQFDRELEPLRFQASLPNQTPESQQQALQALSARQQELSGRPRQFGPELMQQAIRQRFPQARLPQAPAPAATLTAAQPAFTPKFKDPGDDDARQVLLAEARSIGANAQANGDAETANIARDITVRLARQQISPEEASAALAQVAQQGKVTAAQDKQLEAPFVRLQKLNDELRVKKEFSPRTRDLLSRYAQAPASGAERRKYLQALGQEVARLEGQDFLDLPPDDKQRLESAKALQQSRVTSAYENILRDIPKAKNTKAALDLADRLYARAVSEEGKSAGLEVPADLSPEPLYEGETPDEIASRRMTALASRLTDDEADQKAARDLRQRGNVLLERLVFSGKLDPASLARVLGRIEENYAASGGALEIADIKLSGLTDAQREQIRQFNQRMALQREQFGQRKREVERRFQLDERKFDLEQQKWEAVKAERAAKRGGQPDLTKRQEKQLQDYQQRRKIAADIIKTLTGKEFSEDALADKTQLEEAKRRFEEAERGIKGIIGTVTVPEMQGPPYSGARPQPAGAQSGDPVRNVVIQKLLRFKELNGREPTAAERNAISRLVRQRAGN